MRSGEIASCLDEVATRLDLLASRPSHARAYRSLAKRLRGTKGRGGDKLVRPGVSAQLDLPGWLAKDLEALVRAGTFDALEEARFAVPSDIYDLAGTPLGPEAARAIWKCTSATTWAELADVVRGGFLPVIPNFGPRQLARLEALLPATPTGMLLAVALDAGHLLEELLLDSGARRAKIVGAARRGDEIVRTLELLVSGIDAERVAAVLTANDGTLLVRDLVSDPGEVRCVLQGRGPLRITVCAAADWMGELVRATGDDAHVRWLESRATSKGGLGKIARDARSERDVYARLGIAELAPELRRGVTGKKAIDVIEPNALRGAFHVHTDWSDGTSTITAMAEAAARAGYEYVGISDHSRAAPYANGLDGTRLFDQRKAIARARREVNGIEILHGLEVDILPDGTLDLPDATLARLDFVIASVHTDTRMDSKEMTARIVRALSNPLVTMLGHPTGRLLSGKSGYAFDVDAVAKAAKANDTWIEINANGHRLDLSPALARRARAHGVRFVVNPDAHSIDGLLDLDLGERIARRAGLSSDAVVNTRGCRAMVTLLKKRKQRALRRL